MSTKIIRVLSVIALLCGAWNVVSAQELKPGEDRTLPLRSVLANLETGREGAAQRMIKLKQQIDELTQQAGAVVVAPPKEKKEEEKPKQPQKVAFRPPLERISDKQGNLGIVCEGGRISVIDFHLFFEELRPQITKGVSTFNSELGDCDFQVSCSGLNSPSTRKYNFTRKAGTNLLGETPEQAIKPGSKYHALLDKREASKFDLTFFVYPDSFDAFRAVRNVAWSRKYGVDINFIGSGKPLELGSGVGVTQ